MSQTSLSQLRFLRSTLSNIASGAGGNPQLAGQLGVCNRLLDHLIAQSVSTPLQEQCKSSLLALLPRMAEVGVPVADLKAACASPQGQGFEAVFLAAAAAQRDLARLSSGQAAALSLSISQTEGEYRRNFEAAVNEQSATPAATVSAVHNVRSFDREALAGFLHERFPDESSLAITQADFVGGGHSKFTVSLTLANTKRLPQSLILRGDAQATFGGASVVDEYHLLEVLHRHGARVPRPLALEASGRVFGSPFMLVTRESGAAGPDPYNLPAPNAALGADVAAKLAAVHRTPLEALGDRVNNAKGRSSDAVIARLDEGYAAWKPLNMPSPSFEAAFDWLRRHVAIVDERPRGLVHGDFGFHNMLVSESRVSAILDWEFTHVGNPAYDLGYFYFQAQALCPWETFLATYAEAGGSVPDEKLLDYEILFAATRIGVMVQQAVAAFSSGADTGMTGAAIVGRNYYEKAIARVASALEKACRKI